RCSPPLPRSHRPADSHLAARGNNTRIDLRQTGTGACLFSKMKREAIAILSVCEQINPLAPGVNSMKRCVCLIATVAFLAGQTTAWPQDKAAARKKLPDGVYAVERE